MDGDPSKLLANYSPYLHIFPVQHTTARTSIPTAQLRLLNNHTIYNHPPLCDLITYTYYCPRPTCRYPEYAVHLVGVRLVLVEGAAPRVHHRSQQLLEFLELVAVPRPRYQRRRQRSLSDGLAAARAAAVARRVDAAALGIRHSVGRPRGRLQ